MSDNYGLSTTKEAELVHGTTRGIAEVYQEINSANLAEFHEYLNNSNGSKPGFLTLLEDKLNFGIEDEITFVFFAYTDARELNREDMRRIVELSQHFSDVIIQPIQKSLLKALFGSLSDDDLPEGQSLPKNVYRAYKNGIRLFCEETRGINSPVMGVIPLSDHYLQLKDHVDIYSEEQNKVDGLCIDFRACTPTNDNHWQPLRRFLGNMGTRRAYEDWFFYAINPRSTSTHPADSCFAAEDFCLAAMGFDIIGESHIGWGGAESDRIPTIKEFDKTHAIYNEKKVTKLWEEFPTSGLNANQFEGNGTAAIRLQRLYASEQLEFAFRDFRKAIDDDRGFTFLRSKNGVTHSQIDYIKKLANAYSSGTDKDVTEYSA